MAPPEDVSQRVKELEELYVGGVVNADSQSVSIETLLDILLVLYDECQGSTLCRERNISGFVSYGKILFQEYTHDDISSQQSVYNNESLYNHIFSNDSVFIIVMIG